MTDHGGRSSRLVDSGRFRDFVGGYLQRACSRTDKRCGKKTARCVAERLLALRDGRAAVASSKLDDTTAKVPTVPRINPYGTATRSKPTEAQLRRNARQSPNQNFFWGII
jgi:hypothetical protein